MEKIDFKKTLKHLYRAKPDIGEVDAGTGTYLSVKGQGAPGGDAYSEAIQKLYTVAFTLKFSLKHAGVLDFAVSSLETLYQDDPAEVPRDEWRWEILIRIPEDVTEEQLRDTITAVKVSKGLDASAVTRAVLKEGRSLQTLHIGPYDQVGEVYRRMLAHMEENELVCSGLPHEIYLSDPRRVAPEKLKTIVRLPID